MIGKNLKYYRLKKGFSKKELAEVCNISPMAITNYEKDSRTPAIDIIDRLSKALGICINDLFTSPRSNLSFDHAEFRKLTSLTQKNQDLIKEEVEEYFSRFFTIVDILGKNVLPLPHKYHCLTATYDLEKDASELRTSLGFSKTGPIRNLVSSLENNGILLFFLDSNIENFSGMNGNVEGYPYIVINNKQSTERIRSTIAHELAHVIFKNIDANKEKYATALSGAFLLPEYDLKLKLGLQKHSISNDLTLICKEYGVSSLLLVMRAKEIGIISEPIAKNFFIRASIQGWRKNEPSRIEKEEPILFKQLVYRATNEQEITIDKAVELLQIPQNEIEEFLGGLV